jgi:hypothetical protein
VDGRTERLAGQRGWQTGGAARPEGLKGQRVCQASGLAGKRSWQASEPGRTAGLTGQRVGQVSVAGSPAEMLGRLDWKATV